MARVPQDIGEERLVPRREIHAVLTAMMQQQRLRVTWHQMTFIPDFVPKWSMPAMRLIEQICEHIPLVQRLSAHNVAVVVKE
jgi:hypothetical protein